VPDDPALKGAIDIHAHQDPDTNGPSYGQAARSDDALDLYARAKAAGMRGFVIKLHLDQSAGLAYYMRKLHPDMEIFGGMGSNFTTGPKVNYPTPCANATLLPEVKDAIKVTSST